MKTFVSLRCRSEFDRVKQIGRRESDGLFTLLWVAESEEIWRCGIICSRKFDTRAVKRNRARRLLRESLRKIGADALLPCSLILIPRRAILMKKMPIVKNSLVRSLKRAGLLIRNGERDSLQSPQSSS